jgi:hypothetical protein
VLWRNNSAKKQRANRGGNSGRQQYQRHFCNNISKQDGLPIADLALRYTEDLHREIGVEALQ